MKIQKDGRNDPDQALVRDAQSGDMNAFGELYELHEGLTLAMIGRIEKCPDEALDLNQDLWVKMVAKIGTFVPDGGATFKTWLCQCAINMAIDHVRARQRREMVPLRDFDRYGERDDRHPKPARKDQDRISVRDDVRIERHILLEELLPVVRSALGRRNGLIWRLREIDGEEYGDIAVLTDTPLGTVKTRLYRARGRIAERIGSYV